MAGCGIKGDQAEGRLFIHLGDDSAFTAIRQGSDTDALLTALRHGEGQVVLGKVKPAAKVGSRLRRVK